MASWTKDRSGGWIIRVENPPATLVGTDVTVERRDGSKSVERVTVERWRGTDDRGVTVAVCEVVPKSRAAKRAKRECRTGGNCSSVGNGRTCGAHDCDGW